MYHAARASLSSVNPRRVLCTVYSAICSRVLVGFIHRRCRRKEAEANASRYEIPDWYTVPKDLQYLRGKNLFTVLKDLSADRAVPQEHSLTGFDSSYAKQLPNE